MPKKNLVSLADRPAEEVKQIAQMGGKASGEAKRRKKTLREELEIMLEITDSKLGKTAQEGITYALIKKALRGDTKAYEIIRDTIGEKPVERVSVAKVDEETLREIEAMVNDAKGSG